jgi:hypothetical protein
MNMPAISEQVASMEHDLQVALAKVDSLEAEKAALAKALTAMTAEKNALEAKQDGMQSLVDDTRRLTDRLAGIALDMLRTSRRPIAEPELSADNSGSGADLATAELTNEAETPLNPNLTGETIGMRRVPERTAADRLRSQLLMETATVALDTRTRVNLPDGMPMFLQDQKADPRRRPGHRGLA